MLSLKEYKEEYHCPIIACLNVTNQCNLKCRYCFVNQNPERMSFETATTAVTYLYKNLTARREKTGNPHLKGTINFFGGEPLLEWSLIKRLTEWIEEKYANCFNLGITTNGTLLSKQNIDFLYEHKIIPLLSMDGDRETQEYNRPCKLRGSSFDLVKTHLSYLLKKFPNTVFRMTIYEDTCDKLFDNIIFAEQQGFKYFYATPDSRHNFSKENLKKLKIELEKFYSYFTISLINGIKPIESSFIRDMFLGVLREPSLKINELDQLISRDIMRCGLGTVSISIGPDGSIYGCQEQVTNNKENNLFYLGDIYKGIAGDRHIKLLSEYRSLSAITSETESLCEDCGYRKLCYQVQCPSMAKQRFDNFFILPETMCFWNQTLYDLTKQVLSIYNENIERYLTEIIEEEEEYELYCRRNNLS